jgi:type III pantothenate kinase
MLLAIDAGNTNLVFALVEEGKIRARWRIATDPRRTADQYAVWLHQLLQLEGHARDAVDAVIIGTVVPRALHNLEVLASKYFKVGPLIAGQAPVEWGIELDVAEPKTVGADRVLNAIAAHAAHAGDLIVIDFGTATTFDRGRLSGAYKGRHHRARHQPLARRAGHRRRQAPAHRHRGARRNRSVIGRTTEDQMHIGIFWGYVTMIEGLVARMKAEIGRPVKVVSTGGLATLFDSHTESSTRSSPILPFRGLSLLYSGRRRH